MGCEKNAERKQDRTAGDGECEREQHPAKAVERLREISDIVAEVFEVAAVLVNQPPPQLRLVTEPLEFVNLVTEQTSRLHLFIPVRQRLSGLQPKAILQRADPAERFVEAAVDEDVDLLAFAM
jgi:hypothetical protein